MGIDFAGTTEKVQVDTDLRIYPLDSADVTVDQIIEVVDGATNVEGATVEIDGVKKTTNAEGKATFKLISGKTYAVTAPNMLDVILSMKDSFIWILHEPSESILA